MEGKGSGHGAPGGLPLIVRFLDLLHPHPVPPLLPPAGGRRRVAKGQEGWRGVLGSTSRWRTLILVNWQVINVPKVLDALQIVKSMVRHEGHVGLVGFVGLARLASPCAVFPVIWDVFRFTSVGLDEIKYYT